MNTLTQAFETRQAVVLGRRYRAGVRRAKLRLSRHQRIQNCMLGAFIVFFVLTMTLVLVTAYKAYGDVKQGKQVPFPIPLTYLLQDTTGK